MSSVVIAGDTSGSITIAAPAVAGSNTLTLPSATGTVIYSNGSGNLLFNSGYGSVATAYGCRAWVNFNGTGTVAIRASGNVTSITDNSTGNYTVNFTTAMPDINYCGTMGFSNQSGTSQVQAQFSGTQTTTAIVVISTNSASTAFVDLPEISVSVFR